jgi:predicted Fe-Mo cluster-binding NifX family protein
LSVLWLYETMAKKIAIPKFHDMVAPCFETANYFLISRIGKSGEVTERLDSCTGCEGFGRIRLLQDNAVNILICNGIKAFYVDLLESSGLEVIDGVSLTVESALKQYLSGRLKPRNRTFQFQELTCEIPHEDLVCWARELFESHGFMVKAGDENIPFPIDLIAELKCPVCGKPIRIAICCGAHTYRADREIQEFHHSTPSIFHARVYVRPGNPLVEEKCDEYEIQLIDTNSENAIKDEQISDRIPLLKKPITGHERAFNGESTA